MRLHIFNAKYFLDNHSSILMLRNEQYEEGKNGIGTKKFRSNNPYGIITTVP